MVDLEEERLVALDDECAVGHAASVREVGVGAVAAVVEDAGGAQGDERDASEHDQGEADPAVRAMVLIGAGRSFIAGADIRRFGKPRPPSPRRSYDALDAAAKPVVAAQAPVRINHGDLTALLYLQGYGRDEFVVGQGA